MGKDSDLLTPHKSYLELGVDESKRQEAYRSLFEIHLDVAMIKETRDAINKGMALGSDRFKKEIEALYARRITPAAMGRPKKGVV